MSYDPPFVETKILSFAYCCFLDYLRSTNLHINQKTYTHIIEIIKGLAHAKRVTTQTDRILGLSMYFLQQLLTYYGCEYE